MGVETEQVSKSPKSYWDKPNRRNIVRKDAKFNDNFLDTIQRMVGLGFTVKDMGLILGVSWETIKSWKWRYPEFKEACEKGKKIAKTYLIAQMYRSAVGYTYQEEDEKFRKEKNPKTGKARYVAVEKTKKTKLHKGNWELATFLACNLMPDDFKRESQIKVNRTDASISLTGELEKEQIRTLAGKLLEFANERKQIDAKVK